MNSAGLCWCACFYGGAFKSENIRGFHLSLYCLLRAKVVVFAICPNVFTEKNVFRGNNIAKLHVIAEKIAVFPRFFQLIFFALRDICLFSCERGVVFTNHSAICTALSAAPFLIWSLTNQRVKPLGWARSLRIRPTKTSSQLSSSKGHGILALCRIVEQGETFAVCDSFTRCLHSDGAFCFQPNGLCVVAHRWHAHASSAHLDVTVHDLRVSLYIFISSFVYPLSQNTSN